MTAAKWLSEKMRVSQVKPQSQQQKRRLSREIVVKHYSKSFHNMARKIHAQQIKAHNYIASGLWNKQGKSNLHQGHLGSGVSRK